MKFNYVLITPVHNEDKFIEKTIKSVVCQSVLPMRWLIVDDGSGDRTGEIIERCGARHDFIELYRLGRGDIKSYYSRRTEVFLAGYQKIRHMEYDYIAALDADLLLPNNYYEGILQEFDNDPKLGIASGVYLDLINGCPRKVVRSDISTSGGLQVFRRECYEQIGGYVPLKYGGDDSLAEYTARMKGWHTRSFPAYQAIHCRPVGTRGGASLIKARFRQGVTDYYLGTHPVFMFVKSLRRALMEKPYIISGTARMAGFIVGCFSKDKINIPNEIIKYIRREQLSRLQKT